MNNLSITTIPPERRPFHASMGTRPLFRNSSFIENSRSGTKNYYFSNNFICEK